ncbi:hybrid sensor histidine kinase/response regulator [Burkholderia gladioli]|uniref:hybrid sensor histidine kinase/response regulator n=1 Tax=Burkholderia gladioli TaxID=28095 RepID=UPI0015E7BD35|nr:hybrid sensor histidine kinase/response regulator [Burkholderia gladioli]MBA1366684.1 response regulator [Burkholderia gladioli]
MTKNLFQTRRSGLRSIGIHGSPRFAILSIAAIIIVSVVFWTYSALSWLNPRGVYALTGPQENYYWGPAQFEIKLEEFKGDLVQYAFAGTVDFDALELSYNILLSKYFILSVTGDATRSAMAVPEYRAALADLRPPLYSLSPFFERQRISRQDAVAILATLNAMAPDVSRLVHSIGDAEILRRQLAIDDFKSKQFFFLKLSTGLVAIILVGFVGLLWLLRQLRANIRRESELREVKAAFLGMVGHELRSPLQVVTSVIDNLMHEELTRSAMKGVFALERAAQAIDIQLRDITDFALLGTSRLKIVKGWFRMSEVLGVTLESQRELSMKKGIAIEVKFSEHFPLIFSDENRVQQILTNLVSNAIKYSETGPVRVSITAIARGSRSGGEARYDLVIQVRDQGVGISQSDQAQIFKPFVRLADGRASQVPGIGMGLAIVGEIVGLLDGRIAIDSRPGAGSEFTVSLPCEGRPDQEPSLEQRRPGKPSHSMDIAWLRHVLVVDDNPEIVETLVSVFESYGVDVDGVSSAQDAQRQLAAKRYQVVVCDIQMPEMSGFELLEHTRRIGLINDDTIVVALSAYSPLLFDKGDKGMFDVFLSKPLRASDLFSSLSKAARAKGLH